MVVENYTDFYENGQHFRKIYSKGNSSELEWHRDRENRTIEVLSGSDWELQMDNELPKKLEIGSEYHIEKNTFHRVFSGKDDLLINIEKH
jgi:hypothetical protein